MDSSESDSIFSSKDSEQRWVVQITKHFRQDFIVNINEVFACVFNVPKATSFAKPEAYTPQLIALGPYHHMQPELYHMERYKVEAVRNFLNSRGILGSQTQLVDRMKELGPIIRACYHKYLDLDEEILAWIISIDGLFLLHLLGNFYNASCSESKELTHDMNTMLYSDVMMLENQVPIVLLKEIQKSLQLSFGEAKNYDEELLSMMKGFSNAISPLELAQKNQFLNKNNSFLHLLDFMYHLIVNNSVTKIVPNSTKAPEKVAPKNDFVKQDLFGNIGEIVETGMQFRILRKFLKPLQVIINMPWEKVGTLLGLTKLENENNPLIQEISIPSVSKLSKICGINFKHTIGGIRDIKFLEEEATLYLPVITLNSNSEVILRNLVAYEAATLDSTLELGGYVDLMCGIIDSAEDVKLLREKKIIKSNLSNEKIADLFNGMNKSNGSEGSKIVEKINEYYNKKPVIKAYLLVKNRLFASWKILTVFTTVLILLMLILQGFCQFYGCPRFFRQIS
ncbi:hypothetical protein LguiA_018743 [Lonicera macranthoides]